MIRKIALAAAAAIALASSAHAATPVYTSVAFSSMGSPSVSGWCSECNGIQQVVDAFSLSSATVLGGADTAIQSSYGSNQNITVSLYDSSLNVLDSATFAPGSYSLTVLANDVSEVKFDLPGWSVGAGSYYIGFTDFNLGVPGYSVGDADGQYVGTYSLGYSAALQLTSAVPETSNVALMLAGMGALAIGLRRRRA